MSDTAQATPVQTPLPEATTAPVENKASPAPKISPAQDLRDIQELLVLGIFPGRVAPAVIKGFNLLDQMAKTVEDNAKKNEAKPS